jgi:hypothetical protein
MEKELNGKFKLRASETIYQPEAALASIITLALAFATLCQASSHTFKARRPTVYKKGDYFYEPGDITHTAINKTSEPVVIINFELLPKDWNGSSAVLPSATRTPPVPQKRL